MSEEKTWLVEGKSYRLPFGTLEVRSVERSANGVNVVVVHLTTNEGDEVKRRRELSDEDFEKLVRLGPSWNVDGEDA